MAPIIRNNNMEDGVANNGPMAILMGVLYCGFVFILYLCGGGNKKQEKAEEKDAASGLSAPMTGRDYQPIEDDPTSKQQSSPGAPAHSKLFNPPKGVSVTVKTSVDSDLPKKPESAKKANPNAKMDGAAKKANPNAKMDGAAKKANPSAKMDGAAKKAEVEAGKDVKKTATVVKSGKEATGKKAAPVGKKA